MSYPGGTRPHVEAALCLDLKRMFQRGALREDEQTDGRWCWYQEGHVSAVAEYQGELEGDSGLITLDCTGCGDGVGSSAFCDVELESLPCNYGGRIWYFVCPRTGRRARKLYHWPGTHGFYHRDVMRPTYASQRVSGLHRVEKQRRKLRSRMGNPTCDPWAALVRPEGMHSDTFMRYLAREIVLAERHSGYLGLPVKRGALADLLVRKYAKV